MGTSGRNQWQALANASTPQAAETSRIRLPPTATGCLRTSMVRRGRRFESVRGLCKRPARRGFLLRIDADSQDVGQVWSPLWSLQVENAVLESRIALPSSTL